MYQRRLVFPPVVSQIIFFLYKSNSSRRIVDNKPAVSPVASGQPTPISLHSYALTDARPGRLDKQQRQQQQLPIIRVHDAIGASYPPFPGRGLCLSVRLTCKLLPFTAARALRGWLAGSVHA